MTIDHTCPSRETRKVAWPAAGAVESPVGARRRDRRECDIPPLSKGGQS
jgi:hypothetical protein